MNKWPVIKLGEVLLHFREYIENPEHKIYPKLSVKLYGKGVSLDAPADGANLKMKRHQLAKAGQVILSEIWGKKGAIGLVPQDGDGALCTSHFFLFDICEEKLDSRWLQTIFKANYLQEQLDAQARGTTGYAAVRPKNLLACEIPLPPLAEQRRIVARIEELDAQIDEAKELRREATGYVELLFNARASAFFNINNTKESTLLETVSTLERGKFNHRPRNEPCFFGGDHPWIQIGEIENSDKYIKTWSQTLNNDGLAISKKFLRGTVLISIAATIGAVGILDFDCCIPDSIVGVTPNQKTSSEFLYYYLRYLRSHLEGIAPQCAQKNINLAILAKLPFPVYSLSEQNRIVTELNALQEEIGRLTDLHALNTIELNALLPAVLDHAFKGNP